LVFLLLAFCNVVGERRRGREDGTRTYEEQEEAKEQEEQNWPGEV